MSNVTELYHYNKKCETVGDKNVWVEFTALARDYNAVNLGQVAYLLLFPLKSLSYFLQWLDLIEKTRG